MEGSFAGTFMTKVLNPHYCVWCRNTIEERAAYAVGAPYHGLLHLRCAPYFPFDGRYPHQMPMIYYDPPPHPLRTSQDDNGFTSIAPRIVAPR